MISPILPTHDADTIALDFGVFIAEHARAYRVSQTAILSAISPLLLSQLPDFSLAATAVTSGAPQTDVQAEGVTSSSATLSPPEPQPTSTPAVQAQNVESSSKVLDGPSPSLPGAESAADPAPLPKVRTAGRKEDVAKLHAQHTDWTAHQIAAEMGVLVQYVSKTASRLGLTLPLKSEAAEGKRAAAAPIIKDRIKALHAEHPEFHAEQAALHLAVPKGTLDSASFKMGIKWARKAKAPIAEPVKNQKRDPEAKHTEAFDARLIALHQAEPTMIRPRLAESLGVTPSKVNAAVFRLGLHVPHARSTDDQPFEAEAIPPATPQTPVAPPPKQLKTLNDRVAALHAQHPTWTARMIANELGANPGSVSVALARIRNPKAAPVQEAKPEFTGRRQMVEHYGEIAKRLGKQS